MRCSPGRGAASGPLRAGLLPARGGAVDEVHELAHRGGQRPALRHAAVDVDEHERRSPADGAAGGAGRSPPGRCRSGRRRGASRAPRAGLRACAICCTNFGSSGSSAKMTSGRLPLSSSRVGVRVLRPLPRERREREDESGEAGTQHVCLPRRHLASGRRGRRADSRRAGHEREIARPGRRWPPGS